MAANRNKRSHYAIICPFFTVLVCTSGLTQAEEPFVRQSYVMDSSNDRTPAITAFPGYPRIARRDRIEGEAVVCFKISLDGRIRSIKVKSYTDRIFRRPALRAIKESSFEPLRPHEMFSRSRTCRTYRFRLQPLESEEDE